MGVNFFSVLFILFVRRGRDSNPRYGFKPVQRFSKPALSATQAPLRCKAAKIAKYLLDLMKILK